MRSNEIEESPSFATANDSLILRSGSPRDNQFLKNVEPEEDKGEEGGIGYVALEDEDEDDDSL